MFDSFFVALNTSHPYKDICLRKVTFIKSNSMSNHHKKKLTSSDSFNIPGLGLLLWQIVTDSLSPMHCLFAELLILNYWHFLLFFIIALSSKCHITPIAIGLWHDFYNHRLMNFGVWLAFTNIQVEVKGHHYSHLTSVFFRNMYFPTGTNFLLVMELI